MRVILSLLIALSICTGTIEVQSSSRKIYTFTTTDDPINVDLPVLFNCTVTQVQVNLSAAATTDDIIYIRRLSALGIVLAEYAVHPADVAATRFTVVFDNFNLMAGEFISIDWANTDELDVVAGSGVTYAYD